MPAPYSLPDMLDRKRQIITPMCIVLAGLSEREWIDFICYWPGMPLFIKRAYRDEVMIRKLVERVKTFYEILDERMNKVLGIAA